MERKSVQIFTAKKCPKKALVMSVCQQQYSMDESDDESVKGGTTK